MSERLFSRLGHKRRKELLKRNYNRCILCGKTIYDTRRSSATIEHIIPLSIYKWTSYVKNYSEDPLLRVYNGDDNIAIVHSECNSRKGNRILSNEEIRSLYTSEEHKQSIIAIKTELQPYINKYIDLYNKLLARQSNICYKCGSYINRNKSVIRRIDPNQPRSFKNGCLLCNRCNNRSSGEHR